MQDVEVLLEVIMFSLVAAAPMNTGSDSIFIDVEQETATLEIVISSLVLVLDMIILVVLLIYSLEKVSVKKSQRLVIIL